MAFHMFSFGHDAFRICLLSVGTRKPFPVRFSIIMPEGSSLSPLGEVILLRLHTSGRFPHIAVRSAVSSEDEELARDSASFPFHLEVGSSPLRPEAAQGSRYDRMLPSPYGAD